MHTLILDNTAKLLCDWIPGGHIKSGVFYATSITGGDGDNFTYNLKTHLWADVSGDPISGEGLFEVYALIHGISKVEAELKLTDPLEPIIKPAKPEPEPIPQEPENGIVVYDKPSAVATWDSLGLACNNSGLPYANMDNVLRVFERHERFKNFSYFDSFHNKFFITQDNKTTELSDIDKLKITSYLQRDLGLVRMIPEAVSQALKVHAFKTIKNEPCDWIKSLSWDGVSRLHTFFEDCFSCESTDFNQAISQNFWVSIIARLFRPGSKSDYMVVLEGPQGHYKSTALSIIGGKWYTEAHESVMSKDFYVSMQGKFLIEIADLDAFSRAEVNTIKKVITCQTDRFRMPYGEYSADYPRQSIFVGTTNEDNYLSDNTGARRFWPVKINSIRYDLIKENRNQYFAEAYKLFNDGLTWWEVPETAKDVQESRRKSDVWESVIHDFCIGRDETSVIEIARDCLKMEVSKITKSDQIRVGHCLKIVGFDRLLKRIDGQVKRIWVRKTDDL